MTRCDRPKPVNLLGLALSVILALSCRGCYSQREIELTGFILAVGLDRGEEMPVRLVAQLAVPAAVAESRTVAAANRLSCGGGQHHFRGDPGVEHGFARQVVLRR